MVHITSLMFVVLSYIHWVRQIRNNRCDVNDHKLYGIDGVLSTKILQDIRDWNITTTYLILLTPRLR